MSTRQTAYKPGDAASIESAPDRSLEAELPYSTRIEAAKENQLRMNKLRDLPAWRRCPADGELREISSSVGKSMIERKRSMESSATTLAR